MSTDNDYADNISEDRGRQHYHHYGAPPKLIGYVGDDQALFACAESEIGPFIEIVGERMTDYETGKAVRDIIIMPKPASWLTSSVKLHSG
jgi:hypothetical protein